LINLRPDEAQIRIVTATGSNADVTLSPGAGKAWLLISGVVTIITDATAATRTYYVMADNGTDNQNFWTDEGWLNVGASSTTYIFINPAGSRGGWSAVQGAITFPPPNLIINGGERFRLRVINGQAGDRLTVRLKVLEWSL